MSVPEKDKTAILRDIRKLCRLGPLSTPDELKYWVNTDAARNEGRSLRKSISAILGDETDARILVYGHGGSGKSTELAKLVTELGDEFFTVSFSVRNEMNLTAVQAEDLLLVLTERLLSRAQEEKLAVREESIKPVQGYFATVTERVEKGRISTASATGEATAKASYFGLLALMARITGEIKLNVNSSETVVAELRKRPADLLDQIQIVINAVRHALPKEKRLLLIVEDLDKLDIVSARRVFIEQVNLLTGLKVDIIYTVPIFTFHSPDAEVLRKHFRPVGLPMIKVVNWDGSRARGFELVQTIIHMRLNPAWIDYDALELLVEKTGGVLQHAFEVIYNAALLESADVPLRRPVIEAALKYKQSEFWSDITVPDKMPEGVRSVENLYERLEEYAKRQLAGQKNSPKVDAINQILLRACALIEYNGERWYGVHPLVIDNLRELGRID